MLRFITVLLWSQFVWFGPAKLLDRSSSVMKQRYHLSVRDKVTNGRDRCPTRGHQYAGCIKRAQPIGSLLGSGRAAALEGLQKETWPFALLRRKRLNVSDG